MPMYPFPPQFACPPWKVTAGPKIATTVRTMKLLPLLSVSLLGAFVEIASGEPLKKTIAKGSDASGAIPTTPKEVLKQFYTEADSSVIRLEESNFKMCVDAFKATIVYYYTPSCTLCDNLGPAFNMAAKIINQRNLPKNSEVAFAAVDVNAKRVIAEHFNQLQHLLRSAPAGFHEG